MPISNESKIIIKETSDKFSNAITNSLEKFNSRRTLFFTENGNPVQGNSPKKIGDYSDESLRLKMRFLAKTHSELYGIIGVIERDMKQLEKEIEKRGIKI